MKNLLQGFNNKFELAKIVKMEIPEAEERGIERVFAEILAENFSNLMKNINPRSLINSKQDKHKRDPHLDTL